METMHDSTEVTEPAKFASYAEERNYWVCQKQEASAKMAGLTPSAFLHEKNVVLRDYPGDYKGAMRVWRQRRTEMEAARQATSKLLSQIEQQLTRLKPLVRDEAIRLRGGSKQKAETLEGFELFREDGSLSWDAVAAQILLELGAIRQLLEERM